MAEKEVIFQNLLFENSETKLENMCWVCNTPIDESKPSKPYKNAEKEVAVEDSEKPKKEPKLKKKSCEKIH